MIVLNAVTKIYGQYRNRKIILDQADATFEAGEHYVVLGHRGSGKSTLLRLLSGLQYPNRGMIKRRGSVAPPLGSASGVSPRKTPRALIKYLCGIYGCDEHSVTAVVAHALGDDVVMDVGLPQLTIELRAKVNYAIGYALDTDWYLMDEVVAYGDERFRSLCLRMFRQRQRAAGTILVTKNIRNAHLGTRGALLHGGKLYFAKTMADAVGLFQELEANSHADEVDYAEKLAAMGRVGQAKDYLTLIVEEDGGDQRIFESLAKMAFSTKDWDVAVDAAKAGVACSNASLVSYLILAKVAESRGQYADAVEYSKSAAALAPKSLDANGILARSYEKTGQNRSAAAVWRGFSAPNTAVFERRALHNLVLAKDWAGVLSATDVLAGSDAESVTTLDLRVKALLELKEWGRATEELRRLASKSADKALGHLYKLARSDDWSAILDMVDMLHEVDLGSARSSRIMAYLTVTLDRRAFICRREGKERVGDQLQSLSAFLKVIKAPDG